MTAQLAGVAARLLRLPPAGGTPEALQWSTWIADADRLITRYPTVAALLATGALTAEDIDRAVEVAVSEHVRTWRAEASARRVELSIDDGRRGLEYFESAGPLIIPDVVWDQLLPPGSAAAGAFSIRPGFVVDTATPLVP